jgi:dihydropteroate synthase
MGIVNVTPDSFSDGGLYLSHNAAIKHGLQLMHDGADIVDIGGESTRPGAAPVTITQELDRVIPVIAELTAQGVVVSVDTMHAEVADKAIQAGATFINDVTGGLADPGIVDTIVASNATYIASHYRAPAGSPDTHIDPLAEVVAELAARRDFLLNAGVKPEKLILDPGLGFAKNANTNWAILRGLDQIIALGHPVLVGASRKRFLAEWVGSKDTDALDRATAAVTELATASGVWGVRIHNIKPNLPPIRRLSLPVG